MALESICLQKYSNLEILISDDHSPNSVKSVFNQWAYKYPSFSWRYHYQERNLGVAQNQAWLLRNATGHLMTFFQHDDYLIDPEFYLKVAKLISEGNIIGWFQDRTEWGPRALGNRSILADPRNNKMPIKSSYNKYT